MTKAHHITIRTCKITIKAHDRHVMIYKFTEQIQFTQLNRSMDKHIHGYKKRVGGWAVKILLYNHNKIFFFHCACYAMVKKNPSYLMVHNEAPTAISVWATYDVNISESNTSISYSYRSFYSKLIGHKNR